MEYYLSLLLEKYTAQLLIGPIKGNTYTVKARRSSAEEWVSAEYETLGAALFQVANKLYEADQGRLKPPSAS